VAAVGVGVSAAPGTASTGPPERQSMRDAGIGSEPNRSISRGSAGGSCRFSGWPWAPRRDPGLPTPRRNRHGSGPRSPG